MGVWLNSKAFLAISAMCISPILYIYLRNPDGLWATVKDLKTAAFHNDSRTATLFTTKLPPTKEQLIENIMKSHSNGSFLNFDNARKNLTTLLNASCSDGYKVPPIVHYVWFSKVNMEIHEYISVLSMSKFVKPCYILFHGDRVPAGKWWDRLLSEVHNIIHVTVPLPESVFGRPITRVQHRSDVVRLRVLLQYGGIYVDGDQYALRSLDPLRNYTMTLGREDFQSLANSIILVNKESTFLKIWLLSYHMFDDTKWVDNSLRMAHKLNVALSPLLHVEEKGMIWMGRNYGSVYHEDLPWDQAQWYSVHLYSRWFKKRDYEIEDLKKMNSTYGSLSRFVLFGTKDLVK